MTRMDVLRQKFLNMKENYSRPMTLKTQNMTTLLLS